MRQAVGIPVIAVGLITQPEHAEAIVHNGNADCVGLIRAELYDPRWPWHAAAALGGRVGPADQYRRSAPRRRRDLFES